MNAPLPNPVRSLFETTLHDDSVVVNIGPSHPATHGTVQIIAELDGERVVRTDVHAGYLHRGFEKECEAHTWHNLIPYVDRLNYVSALINDFAYCDAVETLMGVQITPPVGDAPSKFDGKITVGSDGLIFSLPAGSDAIKRTRGY